MHIQQRHIGTIDNNKQQVPQSQYIEETNDRNFFFTIKNNIPYKSGDAKKSMYLKRFSGLSNKLPNTPIKKYLLMLIELMKEGLGNEDIEIRISSNKLIIKANHNIFTWMDKASVQLNHLIKDIRNRITLEPTFRMS